MSLCCKNISHSYPGAGRAALQDFSFEFMPGRFYGIFGSNGSGKSTLLKLLAGDLPAGNIFVDDLPLKKLPPRQRARLLAVAEQENELVLPFTVTECIKLGTYAAGGNDENCVTELLKKWQMLDWQDKMFAELSGGERQRVKILRVLAQNTPYILLDEPAASLDWSRQLELYENMHSLARDMNKCIIMVCHDLYMAPGFIDEMLLLHSGRLIYSGLPEAPAAAESISRAFERNIAIERQKGQITLSWR